MADLPQRQPSPPALAGAAGDAAGVAELNLRAALRLLRALRDCGLRHAVICPGSRSAPLAVASGLLEALGLRLHTAIDERSAAFFALALGRAEGIAAAVITTSGSAVAQLLPACVEADHGAIPLLLLSADRPDRLKGCGANQSVNQETFLRGSCRWFGQADGAGLAVMPPDQLERLALQAWRHSLGFTAPPTIGEARDPAIAAPPGAVHLNLPFEEPLHADSRVLALLAAEIAAAIPPPAPAAVIRQGPAGQAPAASAPPAWRAVDSGADSRCAITSAGHPSALDPDRPGLVVAGPWRGAACRWPAHLDALIRWQRRSGWPVLADPLSGLRGHPHLEVVSAYDLLLERPAAALAAPQVLRLGPLPASRRLERWLAGLEATQVLVSEGDPRRLDPLGVVVAQDPRGLVAWLADQDQARRPDQDASFPRPTPASLALLQAWRQAEGPLQALLDRELGGARNAASAPWSEPQLARSLSRLLPAGLPLMLANSSPVRDWESFAAPAAPPRPVFGFRGASGIDGTLSQACGLAEALGSCLLVSGDLALLHDANGWLWRPQLRGRLTVVLIDNGGGGIFEQLPIRAGDDGPLDFERLFAMPQRLDPLALAAAHGVPARRIAAPADLPAALAWGLDQPFSLLLVTSDRRRDAALRRRLRTMAAQTTTP